MNSYTTHWDRPPTDKELDSFYGKTKSTRVHDEIVEAITETVRKVNPNTIGLPYVKYEVINGCGAPKLAMYPLAEVVNDYGTDKGPLQALMAVLAGSDCALVAAWRLALAERYADANADEVEELQA